MQRYRIGNEHHDTLEAAVLAAGGDPAGDLHAQAADLDVEESRVITAWVGGYLGQCTRREWLPVGADEDYAREAFRETFEPTEAELARYAFDSADITGVEIVPLEHEQQQQDRDAARLIGLIGRLQALVNNARARSGEGLERELVAALHNGDTDVALMAGLLKLPARLRVPEDGRLRFEGLLMRLRHTVEYAEFAQDSALDDFDLAGELMEAIGDLEPRLREQGMLD